MQRFFTNNRILLILALVGIVSIAIAFVPATEKDYIVITAPLNNTLGAIQQIGNWKKWHPELAGSKDSVLIKDKTLTFGNHKIEVLTITAFGILVKESNDQRQTLYSLLVQPGEDPNVSVVEIRFSTTVLRLLFDELKNVATSTLNPTLNALRKYLENTESYYGFPIQLRTVTDTLVITTSTEAASVKVTDSLAIMFNRLHAFTNENKLPITDSPIAYIERTGRPTKKLMAGLPVTRQVQATPGLEFQRMPEGRMLTVDFNGSYNEIQKAYMAADRYVTDHNLKTVALPYERYYTKAISSEDSNRMKIRIYIPIL
jgi:effector-binding domain-containing protein